MLALFICVYIYICMFIFVVFIAPNKAVFHTLSIHYGKNISIPQNELSLLRNALHKRHHQYT